MGISWVVCGGESGPGSRGCDIRWLQAIVDQCRLALVACFVKQVGARPYQSPEPAGCMAQELSITDSKGGNPLDWPVELRVREYPR